MDIDTFAKKRLILKNNKRLNQKIAEYFIFTFKMSR